MRILTYILFSFIFLNCGDDQIASIDAPMSEEAFLETLKDIYILDSAFRQKVIKEDYPNQKLPTYYDQVFRNHQIDKSIFDSAYTIYSQQPEIMARINQEIENQIRIEEAELQKEKDDLLE